MAEPKDFNLEEQTSTNRSFTTRQKSNMFLRFRYRFREYLAELLGTMILLLFGNGVVAQVTFNEAAKGSSYLSINLGWGLGLAGAIWVSGPISGAHLNPAVTLANALLRKFPWRKVPGYIISQILGAFLGAALVYLMYWPAFDAFDGGVRQTVGKQATAGIFATYPHPNAPHYNSFITEVIDTVFMMVIILGINDPRHKIPSWMGALAVGLLIAAIGLSIGLMTGYAMNPARDLGPRILTALGGWGSEPFSASNYYFWVPIVGPIVGACLGVLVYDFFIHPAEDEEDDDSSDTDA